MPRAENRDEQNKPGIWKGDHSVMLSAAKQLADEGDRP